MEFAEGHEAVQIARRRRHNAVKMDATVAVQLFADGPLTAAMPTTAPVASVQLTIERGNEEAERFVRGFWMDTTTSAGAVRAERVGSEELPGRAPEQFGVALRDVISEPQFSQNV